MTPMLASDAVEEKIVFPCAIQPKVDGVRGLNMGHGLTARSLKKHANIHTTNFFSMAAFVGFDGELAAEHETHPALCRLTTSAVSTITGQPWLKWHLFDYLVPETRGLTYTARHLALTNRVQEIQEKHPEIAQHIRVIPYVIVHSLAELLHWDAVWLKMGYEGTIIRKPEGLHKQGRSTVREGGLLRIKRFIDAEAKVLGLTEGEANNNEAQTNELGKTFRSSHQENKVGNGMIGSMQCELIADVLHNGKVLFPKGQLVTVSPGEMDHDDRARYFADQTLIVGHVIKFKLFPKGTKDKPRFPVFHSIRSLNDM